MVQFRKHITPIRLINIRSLKLPKGWLSGTMKRHYQEPENFKGFLIFLEPENAKMAHIQAPEIAKLVDRFFMKPTNQIEFIMIIYLIIP